MSVLCNMHYITMCTFMAIFSGTVLLKMVGSSVSGVKSSQLGSVTRVQAVFDFSAHSPTWPSGGI